MHPKMYAELISAIKEKNLTKSELSKLKSRLCLKYNIREMPTDIQILLHASPEDAACLNLVTKPTRTISGVAVVAVMSYPQKCLHGKCLMCPGGPDSNFGSIPQSYTGKEPATMRGIRNNFDPYLQVMNRLEHYIVLGQNPEKVELIIMGGTFPSFDWEYQKDFVNQCFKAMNDFSTLFYKGREFNIAEFKQFFELPGEVADPLRKEKIWQKLDTLKKEQTTLERAQHFNQKESYIKCVGLTLETRPDFAKKEHALKILELGCTRVELGVQSVYDDALTKIQRGHTVKDSVESIRILKDFGFKINAHYMLGLPGVSKEKDIEGLKELFSNPDFRPDMLKLYPCMVVEGTGLYDLWKQGSYLPLTTKEAAEIIAEAKRFIPKYVRIMRVQRDIPTYMTAAGVDKTNLRQYVSELCKEKGIKCNCIRCREIGRADKTRTPCIRIAEYEASKGKEFFISAEDEHGSLYGFCRLRFPSEFLIKEITEGSALVRELHVYGTAAGIGKKGKVQHKGIGKKLLEAAERIAKTNGKKKIVIISGIGVREYYTSLGYCLEGFYMTKNLQ